MCIGNFFFNFAANTAFGVNVQLFPLCFYLALPVCSHGDKYTLKRTERISVIKTDLQAFMYLISSRI
jgi:K+-transporting ATPase A subunit